MKFRVAAMVWVAVLTASPAVAAGWVEIPEPSDPWLFGLGVVGLLVGRRAARKKPPRD